MRRVLHEGYTPRPLQEKVTRKSCPHSSQRARAKPWEKMPHSRYLANAWLTYDLVLRWSPGPRTAPRWPTPAKSQSAPPPFGKTACARGGAGVVALGFAGVNLLSSHGPAGRVAWGSRTENACAAWRPRPRHGWPAERTFRHRLCGLRSSTRESCPCEGIRI